jgi:hypothetical protein
MSDAQDRIADEMAAARIAREDGEAAAHRRSHMESKWRRQVRIDKMATAIYAAQVASPTFESGDDDVKLAVDRALLLATAVDKALGIPS